MKVFGKRSNVFLAVSLVFAVLVFIGFANSNEKSNEEVTLPQFVMASPHPADVELPDGEMLTVAAFGDEVIHYSRTKDDYTILEGDDGYYYYAELDENGDLVKSSKKAKNSNKRSKNDEKFLKKLKKNLGYSEKQKKEKKDKWKKNKNKTNAAGAEGMEGVEFGPIDDAFPTTGTRNMLVLLGDFSDWSFVKTNNDFDNLMNVGSSSFRAYYQDTSYNQLTVNTTVAGPYTINMTMQAADNNYRSYVAQLVDAANNDGINFADFDNNSDGDMDSLYVIHAGYGEEYSGAPTYYIWSHSWDLSTYARTYDGVYISSYATSPEHRGLSGTTISAIGVICHEFGHNLGAPDYYDTDGSGSGGDAWDLRYWDVMAGGSWNNDGDTPAQHCMYTKWQFGWSNPTVISSADTLSLANTMDNNVAYRVNTTTSNEFFILENRQLTGWDAHLDGHGLFIFHVDNAYIEGLSGNTVNANPSHQGLDLEEADDLRSSSNYGGDPFPGTSNNTSFTDTTTPNSKSWANNNTNKPVTNISEVSGTVTFDFMGGSTSDPPVANFTGSPTSVGPGGTVSFSDTSTNAPTSWSWSFPGGTPSSSTAQNPTVTYNTLGTYDVTLTATNAFGSDGETKTDYITVEDQPLVYCDSQGNNYSYEYIGNVTVADLDNTSTGSNYTDYTHLTANLTAGASANVSLTPVFPSSTYTEYWKIWIDYNIDGDFDDAGEEVFSDVGTTTVTGSFTVPAGAEGITRMRVSMKWDAAQTPCETFSYGEVEDYTVNITGGTPPDPPVADFSGTPTTIDEGQSVSFTDLSTNTPTSWSWSFPGGTPSSSTAQNPSVTYNTAGTYNVTLTATNAGGSDGETKTGYITVNVAVPDPPVAEFSASTTSVTEGGNVTFTDLSTNNPTSWAWSFPGGTPSSSTAQNPAVTYNTAGTYDVTLTATNAGGSDGETKTGYITVTEPSTGLVFESGTVSGVGSSWQSVTLANTYTSPVVVCTTGIADSSDLPVVVRVRNAAGNSFDVMVQNPSGTALSGLMVHYVVVEEGVYTSAADGVTMEAVKADSTLTAENNSWVLESRSYQNTYTNPVVVGQVMTYNDADWSVFWACGASRTAPPSSSAFNAGKEVAEDTDTTRADETIGYIVIEQGSGTINSIPYTAALGADTVRGPDNTSTGYTYNFTSVGTVSAAIVSAAAIDGGNGGWPVLYGSNPFTATSITTVCDEDQVGDTERKHTTEQMAYIVFGQ